jgi:glycosyltransferase involved in cell wall biosynthesis
VNIAVVTRYLHRVGGVETYLEHVLPSLAARGHTVGVWHEVDRPSDGERLVPSAIQAWNIGDNHEAALVDLACWLPDVVFLHGLSNPDIESRFASSAPSVLFMHDYQGACISGFKTHQYPAPRPCSRPLGPACLLHYYPHRCGGLHPLSMIEDYSRQRRRQQLLTRCAFVTMLSEHMRHECVAQGVDAERTMALPAFTPLASGVVHAKERERPGESTRRSHLLFAGRMEHLKGGQILLDALDRLDADLRPDVRVTFAGDGRERQRWEQRAAHVARGEMEIRFVGKLGRSALTALLDEVDLLVVPSIWPEPFGLIGIEAAAAGVPSVAFDLGGISEWLTDGVNGRLVQGPPSAERLATVIGECLRTPPNVINSWRAAARREAERRTLGAHMDTLEAVLRRAAGGG